MFFRCVLVLQDHQVTCHFPQPSPFPLKAPWTPLPHHLFSIITHCGNKFLFLPPNYLVLCLGPDRNILLRNSKLKMGHNCSAAGNIPGWREQLTISNTSCAGSDSLEACKKNGVVVWFAKSVEWLRFVSVLEMCVAVVQSLFTPGGACDGFPWKLSVQLHHAGSSGKKAEPDSIFAA